MMLMISKMKTTLTIISLFIINASVVYFIDRPIKNENARLKQELSMYSAKWRSARLQEEVIRLLKQDTAQARYEAQAIIEEKKARATGNFGIVSLCWQPYDRREFSREARIAAQAYKDSIITLKYK